MSSTGYSHQEVEAKWIKAWLEADLYKTEIDSTKPRSERFSIALPPPNVTGELHMGHALGGAIQDILIRYHRMLGHDVLWQIGTDHAGIGTQIVVEKSLKKSEGKTKHDLGREKFIERVKAWKEDYGNKIVEQMKTLGFSPDYQRCRYTMDDAYARAVQAAFVKYYNDGLIYRGKRITNWCPHCLTSLSDLEINKQKANKKLYEIKYLFENSQDGMVVATTRPETMFGDVAVAINPEDKRFAAITSKIKSAPGSVRVVIPFTTKVIPVILDEQVKTDFGTGALKVTPAHDANDYEIGKRHNLEQVVIMTERAVMTGEVPAEFSGLDRYKAREAVLAALEANGQLVKATEYEQEKDLHDRCDTEIEPYLSDQWYVKMKPLAELALKTARESRTAFVPERYTEIYSKWLENIQDWCISRQIWWGHRIPIYYYELDDGTQGCFASLDGTPPPDIKAKNIRQDEDVLDTWFSSALWPYVTMQDDAEVFKHFYPTSILATAREIINLWVSRMIYSSEYFEGVEPFRHVLIHPVVQTPDGKRMSKSKGNAIDPLELIEEYGADASRMWYASVGVLGPQDVRFPGRQDKSTKKWSSDTVEQYRKFANKLFNAARFVTLQLGEGFKPEPLSKLDITKLKAPDIWILSKFNTLLRSLETDYANYDLGAVQSKIYDFIWFNYCDWYIEFSKVDTSTEQKQILYYILEASLRLLHPIMPCITEDIWQDLRIRYGLDNNIIRTELSARRQASISFAKYPRQEILRFAQDDECNAQDDEVASDVEFAIEIISALRNARQTLGISWSNPIELHLSAGVTERESILKLESYIKSIAKVSKIVEANTDLPKPVSTLIVGGTKIQIPLAGLVDLAKLRENVDRKIVNLDKDIKGLEQRLGSENFVKNASVDKVMETKEALEKLLTEKAVYEQEMLALTNP